MRARRRGPLAAVAGANQAAAQPYDLSAPEVTRLPTGRIHSTAALQLMGSPNKIPIPFTNIKSTTQSERDN